MGGRGEDVLLRNSGKFVFRIFRGIRVLVLALGFVFLKFVRGFIICR